MYTYRQRENDTEKKQKEGRTTYPDSGPADSSDQDSPEGEGDLYEDTEDSPVVRSNVLQSCNIDIVHSYLGQLS